MLASQLTEALYDDMKRAAFTKALYSGEAHAVYRTRDGRVEVGKQTDVPDDARVGYIAEPG